MERDFVEHEPRQVTSSFLLSFFLSSLPSTRHLSGCRKSVGFVGWFVFFFAFHIHNRQTDLGKTPSRSPHRPTSERHRGRSGATYAGCSGETPSPLPGRWDGHPSPPNPHTALRDRGWGLLSAPPTGPDPAAAAGAERSGAERNGAGCPPGSISQHRYRSASETAEIIRQTDLGTDSQTCQKCHHPLLLSIR